MKHKCEIQDASLQKFEKKAKGANSLAGEDSAKCNAAMEFIKSLQVQVSYTLFSQAICFVLVSDDFFLDTKNYYFSYIQIHVLEY